MATTIAEALFLLSFFVPPLVVVAGILFLAMPARTRHEARTLQPAR